VTLSDVSKEALQQPILAITRAAPQGAQKAWLLCLQHAINP
jgi:hypothetical protein